MYLAETLTPQTHPHLAIDHDAQARGGGASQVVARAVALDDQQRAAAHTLGEAQAKGARGGQRVVARACGAGGRSGVSRSRI